VSSMVAHSGKKKTGPAWPDRFSHGAERHVPG
jgi:hypothetical protein